MEFKNYCSKVNGLKLTEKEIKQKIKQKSLKEAMEGALYLVCQEMSRYYYAAVHMGIEHMELVSAGNKGLCKAARDYQQEYKTDFCDYARRKINYEITAYLAFHQNKTYSENKESYRQQKAAKELYMKTGKLKKHSRRQVSLSETVKVFGDGNQKTYEDILPDSTEENSEASLFTDEIIKALEKASGKGIHPMASQVLQCRAGVGEYRSVGKLTLEETAREINISKSSVARIENEAREFIRKKFGMTPEN
ncbi:MAG: sigma-70 family RNA polymerase sigma factor [Elusimicrobia bacterium]|jgi:RNA polymerase sigma factor (sigma-70 family)|nr:sigma-70 family RNA polymerase sigma factor [Elusimicrobiota bacterium]